jgi:hypothetical protein
MRPRGWAQGSAALAEAAAVASKTAHTKTLRSRATRRGVSLLSGNLVLTGVLPHHASRPELRRPERALMRLNVETM